MNWEKARLVWRRLPTFLVIGFYLLVGTMAFFWSFVDLYHHQWRQWGLSLLITAITIPAAWLQWKLFNWVDGIFQRWINKR